MTVRCRCGGIGRRKGLKIPRWRHRAGSSPATGTIKGTKEAFCISKKLVYKRLFYIPKILEF